MQQIARRLTIVLKESARFNMTLSIEEKKKIVASILASPNGKERLIAVIAGPLKAKLSALSKVLYTERDLSNEVYSVAHQIVIEELAGDPDTLLERLDQRIEAYCNGK